MNFRSDNNAPVAPEILAALTRVNQGAAPAYGEDEATRALWARFAEIFETDVKVFLVASGTAANAIALASAVPPWGAVICHEEAHIERDECGAFGFFADGAKLALAEGGGAKLSPAGVNAALRRHAGDIHAVVPAALSISQTSERGAVYSPGEVAELGALARAAGLAFHMDGARFANAVAALGCAPADISWRGGVDLLSFGATKNGALGAECIVVFNRAFDEQVERRRKRSGHLLSKCRFVAAQFHAYFENDLWLANAGRANALAARLGEAAGSFLAVPVESNQVFIKPGEAALARLRAAGADFYDWGEAGSGEARLVVSWNHREAEVAGMCAALTALA